MTPYQRIATLDFETFYGPNYTLRSLSTSDYIRHPEFHAHCVGLKINDDPTAWYRHDYIPTALRQIDWKTTALLAHHAGFDGLILSHHYGIIPAYYLDTLSMARALHSNAIGAGLEEVAGFYKIGHKIPDVLKKMSGVRNPEEALLNVLGEYCANDVDLCWGIYQRMIGEFPYVELDLINITVRMFADPVLHLDLPRLKKELMREQEEKVRTIVASGVSLTVLSSSEKFAHELTCSGVEKPPQKISKTTKKSIWAFSKSDPEFLDLRGHPSERVRLLISARLAAKSTLAESRAKRLIDAGRNSQRLPVYLSYFGAHTGRWTGGNKMNLQNLPRSDYDEAGLYSEPSGELRRSILAPADHVIVTVDSAQIEARVLAWLAEDTELLRLFAGSDVYKYMAALIYNIDITEVTPFQRLVGKVAVLGLGYGMGREKLRLTMALGPMGQPPIFMSDEQCHNIVTVYRRERAAITKLWRRLEGVLFSMAREREGEFRGFNWTKDKRVHLPNGTYLQYPYLEFIEGTNQYQYFDYKTIIRNKFKRPDDQEDGKLIWGGAFTENIVQALARVIIGEQMRAIDHHLQEVGDGFVRRIVTMTHDEIVVCVPEQEAETVLGYMLYTMRTPPQWAPDLPLDAEGSYLESYV